MEGTQAHCQHLHIWRADLVMDLDVITTAFVDKDANPTASRFARLVSPVSSEGGKVIETDLGLWDLLVKPGFRERDEAGIPVASFHCAFGVQQVYLVPEGTDVG